MTRTVLSKELRVLWCSPIPYVAAAAFQAVLAVLFVAQLQQRQQALMQPVFPIAGLLLVVAVPVVSMRAVADEARSGTLDLLLAVPVRVRPLVVGKWLAVWITVAAVTAPIWLFAVILRWFGRPDTGPIVGGMLGLLLLAAALAGIGVLASSLTSSQPVAAVAALFVSLVFWFAAAGSGGLGGVAARLSFSERLRTFAGGAIHTADASYFVVVAAIGVVVAVTAVDIRRFR